jgi:hypothetical protein
MKKISLIISLIFTSVTGILTSCSEDYPGPDPVDVTANYSNKFSNPNPTLTLAWVIFMGIPFLMQLNKAVKEASSTITK